jgi:succinate dehydrogenase / fumarate reductase membrane anchor subunit
MSGTQNVPHIDIRRSALGRARGLGAAHQGAAQWWAQRVNSLALTPLTIWFIISVWHLLGATHQAVIAWLSSPWTMALLIALIMATFHHTNLGLQVVIEDYVHDERAKLASLLLIKGLCVLLALVCIVSVLRVGL